MRTLTVVIARSRAGWVSMVPGSIAMAGAALVLLASVACSGDTQRTSGSTTADTEHGLLDASTHEVRGRITADGRCDFGRVVFSGEPDGVIDVQYKLTGEDAELLRTLSEGGPVGARTIDRDPQQCSEVVVTGRSVPSTPPGDGTSSSQEVWSPEVRLDGTPGPP